MKRLSLVILIGAVLCATSAAEKFAFRYQIDDRYRVLSQVDEVVYVNDVFSHRADILNRISIRVQDVADGAGRLEAQFQTSERAYGSGSVYEWAEEYASVFWRDERGAYDIGAEYFMPVVRGVPRFPDRDISEGDTWAAEGEEVHDLRANFGIPRAFHFPISVSYQYLGKVERDGMELDLISISYTVFHRSAFIPGADLYPTRISGVSIQNLYWDNILGRPYAYDEEFDFVFDLSSGDSVEYVGTAEATIVESTRMQKDEVAEEIRRKLEDEDIADAEVTVTEEGVMVTLENIQFLPDSAVLRESEVEKIRVIAEILKLHPERDILVTGHTALAGTAEGRQRLSEERARAVGDRLLGFGAKTADQVVTRGLAAEMPIASNSTEEGRRRNRRVEITILEN